MPESGMLPTSDPATVIPATPGTAPADDAMTALYRVALGPLNTDHYLPVFERFDDAGRTTTTWNWAAALLTINWMVFRKLWTAALVYVAAVQGLGLLLFGVVVPLLQWPQSIEWGLMAAFGLVACAVPGLYGNALLHAETRKRIARALAAARTVQEASTALAQQASSRKRLIGLAIINVVLAGLAAAAYLAVPPNGFGSETSGDRPPSAAPAVTGTVTGPEPTVFDVASATRAAAAASDAAVPASGASAPAAAASTEPAPPGVAAPTPTTTPTTAPTAKSPDAGATPTAPPVADPPYAASSRAPSAPAVADPSARAAAPGARAPSSTAARAAPAKRRASGDGTGSAAASAAPASSASDGPAVVGTQPGYYINVGLFAEEPNARRTQARLLNEGFPAFRQELSTAAGRRIRVRVGPYATRAQADTAARAIRAMSLEAIVFRQ